MPATLVDVGNRRVLVFMPAAPPPEAGDDSDLPLAQRLRAWTEAGAYRMFSVTYHSTVTDIVQSATVEWPDGSAGTFTALSIYNAGHEVDSFSITHTDSGATVTQPAPTRNGQGLITTDPALVVTGI